MENFVYNSTRVFQIFVFIVTMYYLILSLFGLYKKEDKGVESCKAEKKFALLVAAHNEEMVVGKIIESLKDIDYPKHLYDIFVIADNCTDRTAVIAKSHNVNVYERKVPDKRGKGYALEWMFDKIFRMDNKYDAIAIFDADNLVSKNFLNEMNYKLMNGYKVVQGYIDSKNPNDSWITQAYSISFWSANRLFQLARANLGLSNQIGGTGFCMDTEILKKLGWGATCLTEDLEFTCKLVLNGHKVGWAHNAIVYDEKPLTLKQSWHQRKRWMQGFADVNSRFFLKLMKKAIKERDFVLFDCALYTMQPFVTLLIAVSGILTLIQSISTGYSIYTINELFGTTEYGWAVFSMSQFLFTPFIMILDKKISKKMFAVFFMYSLNIVSFIKFKNWVEDPYRIGGISKIPIEYVIMFNVVYIAAFLIALYIVDKKHSLKIFVWYIIYAIYMITWIPITIQGIMDKNKKEWSHTKHIRQISIQEVE